MGEDQPAREQHDVRGRHRPRVGVAGSDALAEHPVPVLELGVEGADPVVPPLDRVAGGGPEVVLEAVDPRPGHRHAVEREPRLLAAARRDVADEPDGRVLAVDVAALVGRALEVELGDVARGEPPLPLVVRDDDQQVDVRRRRSRTRARPSRRRPRPGRRRGPAAARRRGRWSRGDARAASVTRGRPRPRRRASGRRAGSGPRGARTRCRGSCRRAARRRTCRRRRSPARRPGRAAPGSRPGAGVAGSSGASQASASAWSAASRSRTSPSYAASEWSLTCGSPSPGRELPVGDDRLHPVVERRGTRPAPRRRPRRPTPSRSAATNAAARSDPASVRR